MKKTEIIDIVQVETIESELRFQVVIGERKYAKPSYGPRVFVEQRSPEGQMRVQSIGNANNIEEFVTIVKNKEDEYKNTVERG